MKNLEELEKKYLELGREIRVLKIEKNSETNYPIYCRSKKYNSVIEFTSLTEGVVVKQSKLYDVGQKPYLYWVTHTDTDVWEQLDVCPETGFYDGQLVWCWDSDDTHRRELRFYDTKNKGTFYYDGDRRLCFFDNYEPYEGNWPKWSLEAFKTLKR